MPELPFHRSSYSVCSKKPTLPDKESRFFIYYGYERWCPYIPFNSPDSQAAYIKKVIAHHHPQASQNRIPVPVQDQRILQSYPWKEQGACHSCCCRTRHYSSNCSRSYQTTFYCRRNKHYLPQSRHCGAYSLLCRSIA